MDRYYFIYLDNLNNTLSTNMCRLALRCNDIYNIYVTTNKKFYTEVSTLFIQIQNYNKIMPEHIIQLRKELSLLQFGGNLNEFVLNINKYNKLHNTTVGDLNDSINKVYNVLASLNPPHETLENLIKKINRN